MPVYEYECKACGRDFEYQQRISEPEKTTCEACGGTLARLISRTAFALKGAGWYKDLYSKSDGSFDARKGKDFDPKEAKDKAEQAKNKPAADAKSPGSGSEGSGAASGSGTSGTSGSGSSGTTGGGSSSSTAKAS